MFPLDQVLNALDYILKISLKSYSNKMKSTPRCAIILEERLEELKRREDLERLRVPLIDNNLWPDPKPKRVRYHTRP